MCDAAFAHHPDIKSTVRFYIYLNDNLFKYKTKKVKTLTNSTCATEFMSIWYLTREIFNLQNFIADLCIKTDIPQIYNDNVAA